jgi:hypothetical protein
MELNLLISLSGIFGAGLSAYVGVRVALAEVRTQIIALAKDLEQLNSRVERLEGPYFSVTRERP